MIPKLTNKSAGQWSKKEIKEINYKREDSPNIYQNNTVLNKTPFYNGNIKRAEERSERKA